jgi:kynureninase
VPALYAATTGYDLVEEVGVERIRERSLAQTTLLIELLEAAGFELLSPREAERRGGTVVVRTPDLEAVHRELEAREVICDFRPETGIRLGPHYFNTDDELHFAIEQFEQIVSSEPRRRSA